MFYNWIISKLTKFMYLDISVSPINFADVCRVTDYWRVAQGLYYSRNH